MYVLSYVVLSTVVNIVIDLVVMFSQATNMCVYVHPSKHVFTCSICLCSCLFLHSKFHIITKLQVLEVECAKHKDPGHFQY